MAAASTPGPIASSIVKKLSERFTPKHLNVMNESYMHNVPKGLSPLLSLSL
jgi:BolA protein